MKKMKGLLEDINTFGAKESAQEESCGCGCGCSDISEEIAEQKLEKKIEKKIENKGFQKPAMTTKLRINPDIDGPQLMQWPVQLKIVNPDAPYLKGADILIAADCTAYAYAKFHKDFIKGRITMIGCPKFDDKDLYVKKIADIIRKNEIKSIKVVRMSVPCCKGITDIVKEAMLSIPEIVPYEEVHINTEGKIIEKSF